MGLRKQLSNTTMKRLLFPLIATIALTNSVNANIQIKDRLDTPHICLLYTSPSPRDRVLSRMPSSA